MNTLARTYEKMEKSTQVCGRNLGGPGNLSFIRCGGSLPLKKRRIIANAILAPSWPPAVLSAFDRSTNVDRRHTPSLDPSIAEVAVASALVSSFPPPRSLLCKDVAELSGRFNNNREDEKIAALALVAARTSSTTNTENISSETPRPRSDSPQSLNTDLGKQNQPLPVVGSSTNNTSRQRVYHPPLTQPLPNGCHGRTSRNNSYCRRYPRYNGSQYCKLHYQQYVLNNNKPDSSSSNGFQGTSINTTTSAGIMNGKSSSELEAAKAMARQIALSCKPSGTVLNMYQVSNGQNFLISNAKPAYSSSGRQGSHHQDKKFSSLPGESPCKATTTRGRPCAYVSVCNTPYCHLHSEYGTNPPTPRRGAGNNQNQHNNKKNALLSQIVAQINQKAPITPSVPLTLLNRQEQDSTKTLTDLKEEIKASSDSKPGLTKETVYKDELTVQNPVTVKTIEKTLPELSHQAKLNESRIEENYEPDQPVGSDKKQSQETETIKLNESETELTPPESEAAFESSSSSQHSASMTLLSLITQKEPESSLKKNSSPALLELLSSLDSLHWENKRVRIMEGPLAKHSGRILKWRNGWITLKTYVGLHSRRAFELQLLPEVLESHIDYDLVDEPDESCWSDVHFSDNELKEENECDTHQAEKFLSSDIPTSKEDATTREKEAEQNIKDNPEVEKVKSTPEKTPEQNDAKTISDTEGSHTLLTNKDTQQKSSVKINSSPPKSKESPSQERPSVSLGELATLITEGSTSHSEALPFGRRTDLLFGTAAFDRSRRKIKEPTRYNDTSMMERKRLRADSNSSCSSSQSPSRRGTPKSSKHHTHHSPHSQNSPRRGKVKVCLGDTF